jgi:small conductance mechanosensitive channel
MKDNKPLPKDGIKETAKLDQVKKVKVPLTKEQIKARQALIQKIAKISFQSLVVVSALFLAIFSNLLFGDSEFGEIINRTLGKFFDIGSLISNNYLRILETLTILLFIWILNRIYDAVVAIFVPKKAQTGTTMLLLKSLIRNLLAFLGILFILTAWGVDSVTLLASVGLIGLVISFGAQSVVEDIISGLFLIIEKQFSVGDIIIIDDFRGKVM